MVIFCTLYMAYNLLAVMLNLILSLKQFLILRIILSCSDLRRSGICSEHKGANQLCSYCTSDLRFRFRLCKLLVSLCVDSCTFEGFKCLFHWYFFTGNT